MASDIDIGMLTEAINEKLDRDLANTAIPIRSIKTFQKPTAANGYTYYILYDDKWVEQGGINGAATTTLPIEMADTAYCIVFGNKSGQYEQLRITGKTNTSFSAQNADGGGAITFDCQVCGLAAN